MDRTRDDLGGTQVEDRAAYGQGRGGAEPRKPPSRVTWPDGVSETDPDVGSPRLPMTPEAIALHYLDNLDAKVHTFARDIREDRNQASAWTPFNQSLQRRLFKGGTNGVMSDESKVMSDEG